MSEEKRRVPPSGTLLRVLTHTQNASAAVFGVFLTVHLAAPIAASFGGTQAADSVMLLGREYYQSLEPIAVYAPLALHTVSAMARRAILYSRTGKLHLSTHSMLGYALIPLVLPHIMTHRLLPADAAAPISALSPSELGYEYVGYACDTRQYMTAGYVLLAGVALWHSIVGSMKVVSWARGLMKKAEHEVETLVEEGERAQVEAGVRKEGETVRREKKLRRERKARPQVNIRQLVMAVLIPVCLGVVRLTKEARGLSPVIAKRYEAVFASTPWAGLLK